MKKRNRNQVNIIIDDHLKIIINELRIGDNAEIKTISGVIRELLIKEHARRFPEKRKKVS